MRILSHALWLVPWCASGFVNQIPNVSVTSSSSSTVSWSKLEGMKLGWMDFDSMSMAELKQMSHKKGYDTAGKDRVDLIMICKGYADLVKAEPLEQVKERQRRNRAAQMARERAEKEAASKDSNRLIEEESLQRNSYLKARNRRKIDQKPPFRRVDYDTMSMEGLIQTAQGMGYETYQKDKTDLIMICKGYGDAVGAKRVADGEKPTLQQGGMSGGIDYDMISIDELRRMANELGFDTYQKDRTDLIMIAKGYADSARAKPLNGETWQTENAARSLTSNGMHLSGSSNFSVQQQEPTTTSTNGASTMAPYRSATVSYSPPSFISTPPVAPRVQTVPSTVPLASNPLTAAAATVAPTAPMKSDAELARIHGLMTDLDSLTSAQVNRLLAEFDTCYDLDKEKLKQAVIDVYEWEINMHAERLATMQTVIQHMNTGTAKATPTDIQTLKNNIIRQSTPYN
jgi:uncharacterized protein YihD (DUF1040 family)